MITLYASSTPEPSTGLRYRRSSRRAGRVTRTHYSRRLIVNTRNPLKPAQRAVTCAYKQAAGRAPACLPA